MRDVDAGQAKHFGSERVGDVDTEKRSASGEMEDLSDGGIAEIVGGQSVVRFGNLLGGGPGDDPEFRLGRASSDENWREKQHQENCGAGLRCPGHELKIWRPATVVFRPRKIPAQVKRGLMGAPTRFPKFLLVLSRRCPARETSKHSSSRECSCASFSSIIFNCRLSHFGDRVRRRHSEFGAGFASGAGYFYGGAGSSEHDGPAGDQGTASWTEREREGSESCEL